VPGTRGMEDSRMIRRITGIIIGVLVFFLVYWITGLGTPSNPNWALAALIGLVVALLWPWVFGLIMVRRVRENRQAEIDAEVQKQLAKQQQNPPS
jgi:cell shape-determining protein MreD